jgi:DNA-binding XRE family transcriptional regulator
MKICVPSYTKIKENDRTQMVMIVMINADGFIVIMTYHENHKNLRAILLDRMMMFCMYALNMLLIFYKFIIFVGNSQQMKSKKQVLFPKYQRILEQLGENIKLARKRRHLTTIQVSERAGIDRSTLYEIEKGSASVSLGAYFNTLRVLGLQDDFLKLAADDEYGRKLQDLDLINNK